MAEREDVKSLIEKGEAVVFRLETWVDLKKRLNGLLTLSASAVLLFEAGKECGRRSCRRIREQLQLRGGDLLKALEKHKEDERWGDFSFDVDLAKMTGRVVVKSSFEAKKYARTGSSICHFVRGYLVGVLSELFGRDVVLEETLCLSKGDPYCEFRLISLI
jgi:predicted hydrocarbon binding protein